jgi:hypothetical protein
VWVLACSVAVTPAAVPLTTSAVAVAGATVIVDTPEGACELDDEAGVELVEGRVVEAVDAVRAGWLVEVVDVALDDFPQPASTSAMTASPLSRSAVR